MVKSIHLEQEMITLGQFLKYADVISSGGQVKHFLAETPIEVNQEAEQRRGRKLYPGDHIEIKGYGKFQLLSKTGHQL